MFKKDIAKKIAIVSAIIFICFIILFCFLSFLANNGVINGDIENQVLQSVIAFIVFLPLLLSIFFWGQVFKYKSGYWQNAYKIFNFVSIGLFVFSIVQIILSILGVY